MIGYLVNVYEKITNQQDYTLLYKSSLGFYLKYKYSWSGQIIYFYTKKVALYNFKWTSQKRVYVFILTAAGYDFFIFDLTPMTLENYRELDEMIK